MKMALNHHDEICIKEPTAGDNRKKNPTLRKLNTGGLPREIMTVMFL